MCTVLQGQSGRLGNGYSTRLTITPGGRVAAIFVSLGMNAPRHATMHTVFFALSLAIGSAIFLILEMDSPFDGWRHADIRRPVETALEHMVPAGQ
jgi:hypothetical protein